MVDALEVLVAHAGHQRERPPARLGQQLTHIAGKQHGRHGSAVLGSGQALHANQWGCGERATFELQTPPGQGRPRSAPARGCKRLTVSISERQTANWGRSPAPTGASPYSA